MSDDDAALWRHVTRSVQPAGGKQRVGIVPAELYSPARPAPQQTGPGTRTGVGSGVAGVSGRQLPVARSTVASQPTERRAKTGGARTAERHPPRPSEPLQPVVLERRTARRIARGGVEIEARLDLHGMTQDQAHIALAQFVRQCASGGLRTVLVITGKGAPARIDDDGDQSPYGRRERGVLRRNVPRWLSAPDLRPLVISYSVAHVRHGGDGALYVMLRRQGG